MNINLTVQCDTCGAKTNCRLGMSNRDEQPFRFSCKDCGSPIDITIGKKTGGVVGAKQLKGNHWPFDEKTNFVDLHVDFPVKFGPYVAGDTPYMIASQRIAPHEMGLHSARLEKLNNEHEKYPRFATLLKLYKNQKLVPFKLSCAKLFQVQMASDKPQDVNAALYSVIATVMWPFALPGENEDSVDLFRHALFSQSTMRSPIDNFVEEIVTTGFLKNLQLDCLEIYSEILRAELPLRPALFLDFDREYAESPIAMRVSTHQFEQYRDLFKDISEVISRQFVLVAAVNNLQKRGDHNAFLPVVRKGKNIAPPNISVFADLSFGLKHDFIDDSWYKLMDGSVDNLLRNAIAHYKAEYNDVTQIVTYYPKREGIKQEKPVQTYFLEFMRRLLTSYREMHRLHHLIKMLFYYRYLIMELT